MVDISDVVGDRIRALFSPEDYERVAALLREECGDNLPFCDAPDRGPLIERIRCAVLKLSEGNYAELGEAVSLAQIDWRDALVSAGFGDHELVHLAWQSEDPTAG